MTFPFSRFTVSGNSMLPTLRPGDDVLVFNWWRIIGIKKGDLIAIKVNNREIIKRVEKVKERLVFVVGDNKVSSTDSRNFGEISKSAIIGKVIWYGK